MVSWEEDGRNVRDACYHCGMTGKISEDEAFHDNLYMVAEVLAYIQENEYRNYRNECEEDYAFYAAENMMSASEYFRVRCMDRSFRNLEKLTKLPREMQEVLIEWNRIE